MSVIVDPRPRVWRFFQAFWILSISLLAAGASAGAPPAGDESAAPLNKEASAAAVGALQKYLATESKDRGSLATESFSKVPLTRDDAQRARQLLWNDHVAEIRRSRAAEMQAREIVDGSLKMPFYYKIYGEKPPQGRSLYISMHGGGGAPARVNDQQWENQKKLYQLEEGIYLAPRAPTNTWNLWHQEHIDRMFSRLIEDLIVSEDVDPDRVYIMGYSAGGDGVFQLAPRMADRLAAAAMMAGHPNETSPLGLRNLPFTMHVGGLDAAYHRNEVARKWQKQLDDLHAADPGGYVHWVKIYPDKGHWLDRQDAAAIGWMAKFHRNRLPERIVWKQDDVRHARFYWLAVDPQKIEDRAEVTANRNAAQFDVQSKGVPQLTILLCDEMTDLDQPITIESQGETLFSGRVPRTIDVIARTLGERGDPRDVYCSEITVAIPPSAPAQQ